MSLDVADPELDQLAREVAEATGESVVDAAKAPLRERLERVKPPAPARSEVSKEEQERRLAAMRDFTRKFREAPVVDPRTPEQIWGYDENGLPT